MTRTRTIYVLHFEPAYVAPIGDTGRDKIARHYIGSTAGDVQERLELHVAGRGSPLVRAAVGAGCRVLVGATFPGDKRGERRVKRQHHSERFCSLCTETPRGRVPEPRP